MNSLILLRNLIVIAKLKNVIPTASDLVLASKEIKFIVQLKRITKLFQVLLAFQGRKSTLLMLHGGANGVTM